MRAEVCATAAEAGARAARLIAGRLQIAVAERDCATLALSGGRTPAALYAELASARIAWARVHIFQVDERRRGRRPA
jgi:6-phosphogluconolactonase